MDAADVTQYRFIYGTREGELEVRVLAVAHIGETLVRHGLEDGAGHLGQSCLGIVTVANLAHGPADAETGTDVLVGISEQLAGKVARHRARQLAVEHIAAVLLGGMDGQGTIDGSAVGMIACIAVNSQRQFDGNATPLAVRNIAGAARQQILRQRTHVDVVGIVVLSAFRTVHAEGHTGPLACVACRLQAAGHAAEFPATLDVTHATAEAHGIGRHHAVAMAALVGQHHAVPLVAALVEVEGSQIDPRASSHPLVHAELGLFAFVPHGVMGIVNAAVNSLIADVDGIASSLRYGWLVGNHAVLRFAGRRFGHAGRACRKGVLAVNIVAAMKGKALDVCRHPRMPIARLLIAYEAVVVVIVDNDLMSLPVAFTGRIDNGSCPFEHGYEVGHDNGLSKQVFVSGKQGRALPLPPALVYIVVIAVTGPDGQMAVIKSFADFVGTGNVIDPRSPVVVDVAPCLCRQAGSQLYQYY